jgi:hypothetical protein
VVKALEKDRIQPMYAKVREHGAPVQGVRLVAELSKLARKPAPYFAPADKSHEPQVHAVCQE